jgi:hypothetical protein
VADTQRDSPAQRQGKPPDLSRRARQASGLSVVVVRWSRNRRHYERQGVLVEEQALEQAEQQCLADEEARLRRRERDRQRRADEDVKLQARMAEEIGRLFPGCPGPAGRRDRPAPASRGRSPASRCGPPSTGCSPPGLGKTAVAAR